jgi:hypothetical protein
MLQELRMSEMRYRAVLEVLDGAPVVAVTASREVVDFGSGVIHAL